MNTHTLMPLILQPAVPVPTAPSTAVALCKHCGEFADCQGIATAEGYAELAGDYCTDCLTTALIYLAQEHNAYHLTAEDHRDLLLQLIRQRGEQGVTFEEAHALAAWADGTTHAYAMLQLVLSGNAKLAGFRNGEPYFTGGACSPNVACPTDADHP